MTIWVITWSDGYDTGDCFYEAYDNEKDADERALELNKKRRHQDEYLVFEYELNSRVTP